MREIVQAELPWLGDNLLLLDEVRVELERLGIREPVLLRASEHSKRIGTPKARTVAEIGTLRSRSLSAR